MAQNSRTGDLTTLIAAPADAPVEYFTLQVVRISGTPEPGSIVIDIDTAALKAEDVAATMRTAAAAVSASRSTASRYSAKAPTMCRPTRFYPGFRGRKRNFSCGAPPKPI